MPDMVARNWDGFGSQRARSDDWSVDTEAEMSRDYSDAVLTNKHWLLNRIKFRGRRNNDATSGSPC